MCQGELENPSVTTLIHGQIAPFTTNVGTIHPVGAKHENFHHKSHMPYFTAMINSTYSEPLHTLCFLHSISSLSSLTCMIFQPTAPNGFILNFMIRKVNLDNDKVMLISTGLEQLPNIIFVILALLLLFVRKELPN